MYKIFIFFALTLCGMLSAPAVGHAYFTTEQHAFTINDRIGVFTIEYQFGHEKYDVYMPILALRGSTERSDALSYEILNEDDLKTKGTAAGIVLSSTARVEDGMYRIPKGTSATFTLLGFYTPHASEHDDTFRMQVTHLPFSFNETQELQLNPSELTYYVTPALTLTK